MSSRRSASISYLVITGTAGSENVFQGSATVTVDGVVTTNPFYVVGVDGGLLDPPVGDALTLQVFAAGANPNNSQPISSVSETLASDACGGRYGAIAGGCVQGEGSSSYLRRR
jgi:hypothetical protein